MGHLENTKCYLVGPVEHDKSFGKDWREVAVEELNNINVTPYNPLDRPKWMRHIEQFVPMAVSRDEVLDAIEEIKDKERRSKYIIAQQFIRHICLRYVHSCDFVLCYLPNAKTFGSTEELVVAHQARKPIVMICPDRIPSLWVYDIVKDQPVFDDLKAALCYIRQVDRGEVPLDPLKWIFLRDYEDLKLEKQYDW